MSGWNFLELTCLVDDLVDFLELCFSVLTVNILFDEVDRGLRNEKRNILPLTLHIVLKNFEVT